MLFLEWILVTGISRVVLKDKEYFLRFSLV